MSKTDLKRILGELRAVWMLVFVCLILFIATPLFFTVSNLVNVVVAASITLLLAIGQTFVIISGEIDLSVGAVLGLVGVCSALALQSLPVWLAVIVGLGVGAAAGFMNGLLITVFRMPSFIATLGTMSVFSGLTLYITQGNPISVAKAAFLTIGQSKPLGIPAPVWIVITLVILFSVILSRTKFGRFVYAVGDNQEAAKLSGINVSSTKIWAFVISGLLAAVAGFILTARLGTAQPTAGGGLELSAIAAVIIGGTSLAGGRGSLIGTFIGAILLGVIDNGLNLLNISPFLQGVVKGMVILIAVFIDRNSDFITRIKDSLQRSKLTEKPSS